ncbi:MAG: sodium-dependent transporter [OM182 bacterium MED-G24]|uniref:Transporter n=1 Tax=OM182 bacterium MED-G24 TaxID=1986255 RepID=A0A2A5WJT5_9GAMM|nr:MAG: sodium-dependent transporter [OM182 bacterium MED-G24]
MADQSIHGMWSSRLMFVLAAAGSAVGLGNIWRFPYVAGENGGGAFVLVYLGCIALIGFPIVMAEIVLGREGRKSPINTMADLAKRSRRSTIWQAVGWMGAGTGFIILSVYSVIAGWVMAYVIRMASGDLAGADSGSAGAAFDGFTQDAGSVLGWHTLFMILTMFIVARGVGRGIEFAVKYLMPALFFLLLMLVGYSVVTTGPAFGEGLAFMFSFKFDQLTWAAVLLAMGQAFFTLSLGMGTMMTYGAYMPAGASIPGTAAMVAILDTTVAILAGIIIFPLVFANDLTGSTGPGLMFVTLPIAFGQMTGGQVFGTAFFVLVSFAAITSSISMIEPACAWLVEKTGFRRPMVAVILGVIAWVLGLGSALSFNLWSDVQLLGGLNFFESMDYLANNIMLPLGGMLIALFTGWMVDKSIVRQQMAVSEGGLLFFLWIVRVVAPAAVFVVFVMTLLG